MKKNIVSVKTTGLFWIALWIGMFFTNSAEGKLYTIDKNTTVGRCVIVETWIYDDLNDNNPSNDVLVAYHKKVFGNCSIQNNPDYTALEVTPVPASDRISVSFGDETYVKCEFILLQGTMKSSFIQGEFTGTMDIDIQNLSKGTYMLKAYTSSGKLGFVKFIKN